MIQISELKLPATHKEGELRSAAARVLAVDETEIDSISVLKQSVDARKKPALFYVYTVAVSVREEETLLSRSKGKQITRYTPPEPYCIAASPARSALRPVVGGAGPAGLFAALGLARAGQPVVLLERGEQVEARSAKVEGFWSGKLPLDPESNVQFGEGGAGTFSDGKLTSGIRDLRLRYVLSTLVEHGAPADILYSHKPHVGTDLLREVVRSIRTELQARGCDVRFGHKLVGLRSEGGRLCGITVEANGERYSEDCDSLVLAPGHSARDTFRMLQQHSVPMEQKAFAMGLRIEHKQEAMSRAQYGKNFQDLPPTDYKLVAHLPNGRSVFSFCVCPGGVVVASASEPGRLVTNGMSYHSRDGENINGALLVGLHPTDFVGSDPLAGLLLQESLEQAAFVAGGSNGHAPVQRVGDFLIGKASTGHGAVVPSYRPGVRYTDLALCLPDFLTESIRAALPLLGQKVRGFDAADAILTGVESRSSAPLRLLRDGTTYASAIAGLYPCGEGAGYAGGIVSAAVDGLRVAESICAR